MKPISHIHFNFHQFLLRIPMISNTIRSPWFRLTEWMKYPVVGSWTKIFSLWPFVLKSNLNSLPVCETTLLLSCAFNILLSKPSMVFSHRGGTEITKGKTCQGSACSPKARIPNENGMTLRGGVAGATSSAENEK